MGYVRGGNVVVPVGTAVYLACQFIPACRPVRAEEERGVSLLPCLIARVRRIIVCVVDVEIHCVVREVHERVRIPNVTFDNFGSAACKVNRFVRRIHLIKLGPSVYVQAGRVRVPVVIRSASVRPYHIRTQRVVVRDKPRGVVTRIQNIPALVIPRNGRIVYRKIAIILNSCIEDSGCVPVDYYVRDRVHDGDVKLPDNIDCLVC